MFPFPRKPHYLTLFASITLCLATLPPSGLAADTKIDINASATDLTSAAGDTPGTIPSAATDVTFTAGTTHATPAGFTINNSIAFGSLNDLTSGAFAVTKTGNGTLTLGGAASTSSGGPVIHRSPNAPAQPSRFPPMPLRPAKSRSVQLAVFASASLLAVGKLVAPTTASNS